MNSSRVVIKLYVCYDPESSHFIFLFTMTQRPQSLFREPSDTLTGSSVSPADVTITDLLTRLGTRSILTLYEIAPDRTWGSTYVYFYLLLHFTNVLGSCTVHGALLFDGNASTAFWAFAPYIELFLIDGSTKGTCRLGTLVFLECLVDDG